MAGARIYNEGNKKFYQNFTENRKAGNIKTGRKEMASLWR